MTRALIRSLAMLALVLILAWPPGTRAGQPAPGDRIVALVQIANDHDPSISTLGLLVDPRERVRGISIVTRHPAGESPAHTVRRHFTLQRVGSPRGIVVTRKHGREVIALRGHIDPDTGRGVLTIRYLSNALFGSHRECRIRLVHDARGWRLTEPGGAVVTDLYVKTWFLGVSTIAPVCPHG
ncbi:MAG TPA: hypothetical protein ENH08_01780 [Chromatiales bacterium]|nr:hypothetical protein [Chromatiales bacterium]